MFKSRRDLISYLLLVFLLFAFNIFTIVDSERQFLDYYSAYTWLLFLAFLAIGLYNARKLIPKKLDDFKAELQEIENETCRAIQEKYNLKGVLEFCGKRLVFRREMNFFESCKVLFTFKRYVPEIYLYDQYERAFIALNSQIAMDCIFKIRLEHVSDGHYSERFLKICCTEGVKTLRLEDGWNHETFLRSKKIPYNKRQYSS